MSNGINFLPPWAETNLQPAFYDLESGTCLQQTSRMYAKVNQLIRSVNEQNKTIADYVQQFTELRNFVEDYFDNLDVQDEINHKLDEMVNNGTFELLFTKYIAPYFETINRDIEELDTKVSSLNNISPTVVTSADAMVDHDKTYVLTTDGKWYYWNGAAFVAGGDYTSDAIASDMKWYLNDVAGDNHSIYNPWNAWEGGLASADGSASTSQQNIETYWTTDYIELGEPILENNFYKFLAFGTLLDNDLVYYKFCAYDEDKGFLYASQPNTGKNRIDVNVKGVDCSDWKYVRIQFKKADISFDDRYKLIFTPALGVVNTPEASRYTSIDTYGIKAGSIEGNRLADNLYITNVYSMLEQEIVPFTKTDFVFGTITTATGTLNDYQGNLRLALGKLFKVPGGTTITLTNDWKLIAFSYDINDNFLGRYTTDWVTSVYFPVDAKTKLVFKNDTLGDITSEEDVINLLNNISIEKQEGAFYYEGEKVVPRHKFGATFTGLKMAGQDSAIASDGHIICFDHDGHYKVMNIYGQELKPLTDLDNRAVINPHSNCAFFGTEKYDADDLYPIVYTNAYNTVGLPQGTFYAYRLKNDLTTTFLQTIKIGFTDSNIWTGGGANVRPYGNFLMDTDNNKLYAYTMIDNLHVTRFFKFSMPSISDGAEVVLQESDIEDYFDVDYFYYIQGGCYYNGKIYASCGFTSSDCMLYAVDLNSKSITSRIPLGGFVGEPETVFIYNDELYVSSGTSLYELKF